MSIIIPLTESDWCRFCHTNRMQGTIVRSRFKGVVVIYFIKKVHFRSQCAIIGYEKTLGLFPLTEQGEIDAFKAYIDYLDTVPKCEISKHPGRVTPDKINTRLQFEAYINSKI